MRIIDRYLLKQFVVVFGICFCSLAGLYVVFDAFSNLDEFQRYADKRGSLLGSLAEYYVYRLVFFFDRSSGVLALVAAMFTVTWIQRHQEMTALMAAGITRARVIRPIILACVAISGVAATNRELVIPRLREELGRNAKDLLGETAQDFRHRYDNQTLILFRGEMTYANEQRILHPNFLLPAGLDRLGKQLVAENAYYQPPTADRPGGYLFKGVSAPAALTTSPSLSRNGEPVVITPLDQPGWLKPDECFVVSQVSFDQLRGSVAWKQYSSTRELIAGLHNKSLDFGADVRVAIHARVVQPGLDLTLLFLGLPLMVSRENRNVFAAIGLCGAVVGAFMLIVLGFQYLGGISYLSPATSVWIPLAIFVPLAVGMYEGVKN